MAITTRAALPHDALEPVPTPTPEELLAEETELELARFDVNDAWFVGSRIRDMAVDRKLPISIAVYHGADLVFFAMLPGASGDNRDWLERKRAVVDRFRRSSLYLRLAGEREGVDFNARYRLPVERFVASGGGIPIVVSGVGMVGCAVVSGLPDVDDHRLAVSAVRALQAVQRSST
jgi:uncharacterized protein (UPF0303 family)